MTNGYQVYAVDEDPAIGSSIRFLLATLKLGCRPFRDSGHFLNELSRLAPGCILIDIAMPGLDGARLQAELARRGLDWPVIFMAEPGDIAAVARAVRSQAADFLVKPFSDEALLGALHKAFVRLGEWERVGARAQAR